MQIHGEMIEINFKDSHLCLTAASKIQWKWKDTYRIQYPSNTCILFWIGMKISITKPSSSFQDRISAELESQLEERKVYHKKKPIQKTDAVSTQLGLFSQYLRDTTNNLPRRIEEGKVLW